MARPALSSTKNEPPTLLNPPATPQTVHTLLNHTLNWPSFFFSPRVKEMCEDQFNPPTPSILFFFFVTVLFCKIPKRPSIKIPQQPDKKKYNNLQYPPQGDQT